MGREPGDAAHEAKDKETYIGLAPGKIYKDNNKPTGGIAPGCLCGETPILTPEGYVAIKDLFVNYPILSYKNGFFNTAKVTSILELGDVKIVSLLFASGKSIRCSRSHSFMSEGKWKIAAFLKKGDSILFCNDKNQQFVDVLSAVKYEESRDSVYRIRIGGAHSFIASGAVTSCFSYMREERVYIQKLIYYLYDNKNDTCEV